MLKRYLPYILMAVALILGIFIHFWASFDHPDSYEIGGFEYISQPDGITCGPTSGLMVLKHYGKDATLEDIKKEAKTQWFNYKGEPVGMTSPDYLAKSLTRLGLPCKQMHGDIRMIKHFISKKRPVIVLVRSGPTTWHYMVAIGYTPDEMVFAEPGSGGRFVTTTQQFEDCWRFKSDMHGRSIKTTCPICGGSGKMFDMDFGPINRCDLCGGTGEQPDYLRNLLLSADVYPNTMIVPGVHIEE